MHRLFLSDFDGTLTVKDTMMSIIIFHRGRWWLLMTLLMLAPLIVLMMAGLYSNQKTKQRLLHRAFGSLTPQEFSDLCQRFADTHRHLLRKELWEHLRRQQADGADVYVITASPYDWVSRMVPEFRVIGTQIDLTTWQFVTPNCYGQEKVCRVCAAIPELTSHRDRYHITAYGDSRGDREMLAFADEAHIL